MRPGEASAGASSMPLRGSSCRCASSSMTFHVLAWDGVTLKEPVGTEVAMLSAGNRGGPGRRVPHADDDQCVDVVAGVDRGHRDAARGAKRPRRVDGADDQDHRPAYGTRELPEFP